jgi:hypothetical protein
MTANHDLERRVAAFYGSEAPQRAPDRVLEQALATIETTRQRRELELVPWRFRTMNSYAKLAIAAVVVLAVGAVGLAVLGPGSGPSVGGPNASPSAAPSTPPSASPSQPPSAAITPAPLTETYTSALHGVSISHPAGWTTVPATDLNPGPTAEPLFLSPAGDFIHDPELGDHLFIALGSEALGGQAGEAWATAIMDDSNVGCTTDRESTTVDGAPGLICDTLALVWIGDRGYSIRLHVSGDDPEVARAYDRAWFEDVLATVQLPAGS